MSDGTAIEWTDATLNVVNGCSIVSPGCTNCYAMRSGGRNLPHHPATGLTMPSKAGHVWTGEVRFNDKALLLPLRWKRPRKIFWNAHGDLFHPSVPFEWVDRCVAVMALTPHHIHQVLTKRPYRMRKYFALQVEGDRHVSDHVDLWETQGLIPKHIDTFRGWIGSPGRPKPLPNVWLGVSVEDQQRADERIPILLDTPAAVRWLSCEPLLGPVDLTKLPHPERPLLTLDSLTGRAACGPSFFQYFKINWVIAGGESGPGARPMHPDWARSLRDQCAAAGVPFLFKQWGEWAPGGEWNFLRDPALAHQKGFATILPIGTCMGRGYFPQTARNAADIVRLGKKAAGRLLDGVQHDGYPA